jgi:acyl transferase domain-containing protein
MKHRAKPEPIAIVGWLSLSLRHGQSSRFLDVLRSGSDAIIEVPKDRSDSNRFYDPVPESRGKDVRSSGGFFARAHRPVRCFVVRDFTA